MGSSVGCSVAKHRPGQPGTGSVLQLLHLGSTGPMAVNHCSCDTLPAACDCVTSDRAASVPDAIEGLQRAPQMHLLVEKPQQHGAHSSTVPTAACQPRCQDEICQEPAAPAPSLQLCELLPTFVWCFMAACVGSDLPAHSSGARELQEVRVAVMESAPPL